MNAIVYEINENGNRVDGAPNWEGEFYENNTEDSIWLYIRSINGKDAPVKKGMRIHYSDDIFSANYIIIDANMGIYRVERLQ